MSALNGGSNRKTHVLFANSKSLLSRLQMRRMHLQMRLSLKMRKNCLVGYSQLCIIAITSSQMRASTLHHTALTRTRRKKRRMTNPSQS